VIDSEDYSATVINSTATTSTWASRHQKGTTILDFNEARDDGVAVVSVGLYADNHLHLAADRKPNQHLINQCLQAGCFASRSTNSVKALKAKQ